MGTDEIIELEVREKIQGEVEYKKTAKTGKEGILPPKED